MHENDPTYMSEARQRVSIAAVFGKEEEKVETPLPRPLQDALSYAERASYGPLVNSTITGNTLTLVFRNGKRATWRPDPRFLAVIYGSPKMTEVVERHGWAEQLRIDQRK